jgi:hypothetical protein
MIRERGGGDREKEREKDREIYGKALVSEQWRENIIGEERREKRDETLTLAST